LNIPLILIESLGAAYMTTLTSKPTWATKYDDNGVGGLIAAGLSPLGGFGGFLTVLMALSIVANNIPNIYSMSLTVQIFGKHFQAIPRLFITILGTGAYIVLAIVGASHFDSWLNTLLVILSYWLSIFFVSFIFMFISPI
jgi:purine-cytosine permease-like protein